jgi:pimeloyl-[acyl-carrier protein] methyl ester esterase
MADVVTGSGQRLHVEEQGDGPPVLLIHGWAMSSAALQPLSSRLADGRRTLRYDLRGHGRSPAAGSATLADHAADLAGLLEALALEEVWVVAWSLGAQVLLRSLPAARPRLRGAVLIGATPRFTLGDGWSHGLPARQVEVLAQRFRRDPARTRARFLGDMLAPPERDRLGAEGLAAIDAAMPLPEAGAALAGLEILATADLRAELPAVDLPVLLLHGAADPICVPDASLAMADAIPGARRIALPDTGHAPFLTRGEEVAGAILDFAGRRP